MGEVPPSCNQPSAFAAMECRPQRPKPSVLTVLAGNHADDVDDGANEVAIAGVGAASSSIGGFGTTSSARHPAAEVVAQSAGRRTWAAWAGRDSPSNTGRWEHGDLSKGFLRLFQQSFSCTRPPPVQCPICCTEPESEQIVLWCGCAVCEMCMRSWVAAQLEEHSSAEFVLHCPICRAIMRPSDASRAMTLDPGIYDNYFEKLLVQSLRLDPGFVSCPKCKGGGFVSGPCMEQVRLECWRDLKEKQSQAKNVAVFLWFVLSSLLCVCEVGRIQILISAPLLLAIACLTEYTHRRVRHWLQSTLNAPTQVGCPCCEASFALSGQADQSSEVWLRQHSRPCPRCKAPIEKQGGCNHMACAACQLKFCWACMRPSWVCGAYSCSNGAPFGNAGVSGSVSQASDSSFIGTIYEFRAVAILALVACGLECVFRKPAFSALHDFLWLGLEIMWFWVRFVCLCTCVIIVSMLIFRGAAGAREPNGSRLTTPLLQV
mmetsp:Transcript_25539/g.71921  ORF Transcript_25539/g.71921 Transcript_25539/m.71921 type:complete len:488 (+) Transcript_25539:3-1466(+)